jgi:hypothetical protein
VLLVSAVSVGFDFDMSAVGQTETSAYPPGMSVLPPEADVVMVHAQVRLVPKPEVAGAGSSK